MIYVHDMSCSIQRGMAFAVGGIMVIGMNWEADCGPDLAFTDYRIACFRVCR